MEKEMFETYRQFTAHDFIADPSFCDWVLQPDEGTGDFWEAFFREHPHKKEEAGVAVKFLQSLSFREDFPEDELVKASLAKHLQQVQGYGDASVVKMLAKKRSRALIGIAACVAGIIILASIALFRTDKAVAPQTVKTGFSQLQNITLPDGSTVMLNANSSLQYSKAWKANEPREVWLTGEGYFDVKHLNNDTANIKSGERFLVYANGLTIEVLGTAFDIRNRRGRTEVVLEKGKIKLSFPNNSQPDLVMKPGDMIAYDSAESKLETARINTGNYTAWREKKLILTDPKVSEIVQYLEDNFGYRIEIEGAGLAERRIEGPILLTNLDDAVFVLSTVLNTNVIRKDSTIVLRAK